LALILRSIKAGGKTDTPININNYNLTYRKKNRKAIKKVQTIQK
jgi:hypothetical protein